MAFGVHRFYLARSFRVGVKSRFRCQPQRSPTRLPSVTVQLPLYNERYVAERAIRALAALDYPHDRLDIQVLDDSTDDTSKRVAACVTELQREGLHIRHVRRRLRSGYKAGALANGLQQSSSELIAIFDADFVPHPDVLKCVVGEFEKPGVGMVQARWAHLNEDHSILTRAQALQLDAHFTIEHGVRHGYGFFFNFNGTAGVWRRQAIDDAGGWQADTLTEDLDLSYRAQLCGWRFVYRDDVAVPAELPIEVAAYRQQQQRWAQGGTQAALKLLPEIFRAPLSFAIKREAAWHLLAHFAYPLLGLVTIAGLAIGVIAEAPLARWVLAADGILLTVAMGALGYFYGVAAEARSDDRTSWTRRLLLVPAIMILGAGIAAGQAGAVFRGLIGRRTPFRRTPKYDVAASGISWQRAAYRLQAGRPAVVDCLAGTVLLVGGALQSFRGGIVPSGLVLLFGVGFLTVGATSLLQILRRS